MSRTETSTIAETTDPGAVKQHWITALALLTAAFLAFLSIAGFLASDPEYQTEDRVTGVLAALAAAAVIGGLWGLRTGRLRLWVAHTLIVLGSVFTAMFFWLFFVPTIIAATVIYTGVIKRGLERELLPS